MLFEFNSNTVSFVVQTLQNLGSSMRDWNHNTKIDRCCKGNEWSRARQTETQEGVDILRDREASRLQYHFTPGGYQQICKQNENEQQKVTK